MAWIKTSLRLYGILLHDKRVLMHFSSAILDVLAEKSEKLWKQICAISSFRPENNVTRKNENTKRRHMKRRNNATRKDEMTSREKTK